MIYIIHNPINDGDASYSFSRQLADLIGTGNVGDIIAQDPAQPGQDWAGYYWSSAQNLMSIADMIADGVIKESDTIIFNWHEDPIINPVFNLTSHYGINCKLMHMGKRGAVDWMAEKHVSFNDFKQEYKNA